uniref:Uncharacterized protein n=1 Tax=Anopheles funestus TaxID=62324 RepID=A0A182RES9_ANOFN
MAVKKVAALTCVERELLTWKLRAERAEKAQGVSLNSSALSLAPLILSDIPISSKRGRNERTPDAEEETTKKQKSEFTGNPQRARNEKGTTQLNGEWIPVAKRKQQKNNLTTDSEIPATPSLPKPKPFPRHPRSEAIVVGLREADSYASILRKVKDDPSLQALGKCVSKVRRTQNGNMLFELKTE